MRKRGIRILETFEQLMEEIYKAANGALPNMAKILLPFALEEKTKERLLKSRKTPAQLAQVFVEAIDTIDHGSIESVDSLVCRKMGYIG